jgi:hypothetical protein
MGTLEDRLSRGYLITNFAQPELEKNRIDQKLFGYNINI